MGKYVQRNNENSMKMRTPLCRSILHTLWCCSLGVSLLPSGGKGQVAESQSAQIAESLGRVKAGSFVFTDIIAIAQAGLASQVLPALEEQFARADDPESQGIVAVALVRLGDKDERYWEYLKQQATSAVESDIPVAFRHADGRPTKQHSAEFIAWASSHHLDLNSAVEAWAYGLPGKVLQLSMATDRRSIPILQRGLQSRDVNIVMTAAEGLAQLQDKESIPAIITACKRFDASEAAAIADHSLVYFDDSQAQAAVDAWVPKDLATAQRQAIAQGRKPFD